MNDLASAILAALKEKRGLERTYGEVASTSPLMVKVGPSIVPTSLPALSSYTPQVGDFVVILKDGPDRLVLGAIADPVTHNVARGRYASATLVSPNPTPAAGTPTITELNGAFNVTLLTGRRYRFDCLIRAFNSASAHVGFNLFIRDGSGGSRWPASGWDSWSEWNGTYYAHATLTFEVDGDGVERDFRLTSEWYSASAGTIWTDFASHFTIYDVGPS